MLNRFLLPRGAAMFVGRLFATSAPRLMVPTEAQLLQLMNAQQTIQLKPRRRIGKTVATRKAQAVNAEAPLKKLKKAPRLKLTKVRTRDHSAQQPIATNRKIHRQCPPYDEKAVTNLKEVSHLQTAWLTAKDKEVKAFASFKKERRAFFLLVGFQWHRLGKNLSSAFSVFMDEHAELSLTRRDVNARERIHSQFKALTAEERLPYEKKAEVYRKVREAALELAKTRDVLNVLTTKGKASIPKIQ